MAFDLIATACAIGVTAYAYVWRVFYKALIEEVEEMNDPNVDMIVAGSLGTAFLVFIAFFWPLWFVMGVLKWVFLVVTGRNGENE